MWTGCFCTCLSFQAETVYQTWQKMLHNYLQTFVHNGWFQFRLSLLKDDYELWGFVLFAKIPTFSPCHDPLVWPPPALLISPISVQTGSGTDRSFQQRRAHSSGLSPPSPTDFYSPPAPVPLPPFSLSAPIPIPWYLWSLLVLSWNNLLIVIIVCYVCMSPILSMLCIRPGSLAVLRSNCVVQVWVYMPHYTKWKARSLRGEKRGQGFRLSYYGVCLILTMNNVVEQRAKINFCVRLLSHLK